MQAIQTFKGTKDIFGDDMRFRTHVLDTIREVFELFGFEPLETPVIERKETLYGKYGDEAENLLFLLAKPHEDGGLRYDHTVPLARFAASHWHDLPKPYKRYVIGPVFRAENPQSGRFRQFYQCDFDTLGSTSLAVDAEIVAVNSTVLTRLGFTDEFVVQVNDRRLLNAMVAEMGFVKKEQVVAILRAWDKLDKISPEEALKYLVDEMKDLGVSQSMLKKTYQPKTLELLALAQEPSGKVFTKLSKMFTSKESQEAINILQALNDQIKSLGVPVANYQINPLLARGLSYYTGPIFETVVKKAGLGSITGGGRFDHLIEAMGGPAVPASGSSFGLDRLLVVIEQLGLKPQSSQITKVFVSLFDTTNSELTQKTLVLAKKLRENNIPTEVYSGDATKLGKQIELAAKKNIQYLLILGPEELEKQIVVLKNLHERKEQKVDWKDLISMISET